MTNIFKKSFINDEEKMRDFYALSKEEFLANYSYLTEEEYDATVQDFIKRMRPYQTSAGTITTRFYDDECAKGIQIFLNDEIVCLLDVYEAKEGEPEGEARVLAYKKDTYPDGITDEPFACITINR